MSQRKRNAPRTPEEVRADIERAPEMNRPGADPHSEAVALVQRARDVETQRQGLRVNMLPRDVLPLQRLLIALLETLTPEQRAEVRRRLGE